MASNNYPFEKPEDPIDPPLNSIGRSIADRWFIREMVLKFYASDYILEILARLNIRTDGIELNIGEVLDKELGSTNDNTPETRRDCEKRIRYLIDEIQAMRKASRDKGQ